MAKKSLNMIEKMMDPNIIDYYIINCAIPSIITIENCYQINFGKPGWQKITSHQEVAEYFSQLLELILRKLPYLQILIH